MIFSFLLIPEDDLDRHTGKIKLFPDLVHKVSFIRRLDILGMIAEKSKCGGFGR
jgi:hypothetical protein